MHHTLLLLALLTAFPAPADSLTSLDEVLQINPSGNVLAHAAASATATIRGNIALMGGRNVLVPCMQPRPLESRRRAIWLC